jgi:hypothetical protein
MDLSGDNPQGEYEASTMSNWCRRCYHGGSQEYKVSEEGILNWWIVITFTHLLGTLLTFYEGCK